MGASLRTAVAAGPPLVRHGLALQLRLAGVAVVGEPGSLDGLDPEARLDTVLLVGDPDRTPGVQAVRSRGIDVVALVEAHPDPGFVAFPRPPGAHPHAVGRLAVLTFSEVTDVDTLVARLRGNPYRRPDPPAALTPTERAVHALLGQGYSNAGIARLLCLSPKTVEGCVSALFDKLGLVGADPARNRRVAAALTWVAATG